jgi:hypothetical protein
MRIPLVLLLVVALQAPALAQAAEYRPRKSGHPVRVVAYLLHPIGFLLDRGLFYTAWLIGRQDYIAPLVGMKRTVRDVVVDPKPTPRYPNVLIEIGPAEPPEQTAPEAEPETDEPEPQPQP